ncbi:hypothetical protein [Deferrisoma palaeochoriense]
MKTMRILLAGAAAAVLAAASANAAVNGSHHDLSAYQGATEVCLYCHGVLDTTAATGNYGNVGELCLSRCHRGGTAYVTTATVVPEIAATLDESGTVVPVSYSVNAVNVTNGFAHGLNPADLLVSTTGAQVTFDAVGQGLPYGTATQLECTSCHNVHDNTNTPFLQLDLFTGGPGGESFCEACHTDRGNSWVGGEAAPNGEHPVNFALILNANVGTSAGNRTNAERYGRYINLDGNIFDVATANGAALNDPAQHYTPGGKVSTWANAAGGETFGCYTCHGVHVPTNDRPGQPNLILRDAVSADGTWNPICVGCHGTDATGVDDPNPGTTAYYHPVGSAANAGTAGAGNIYTYTTSTGNFSFQVDLSAINAASGGGQNGIADNVVGIEGTTGKPRCGSCHDVHGGINNSMALVDLDGARDGAFTGKICDACHTGVGLPDVADNAGSAGEPANSHHRTRTGDWGTATVTDADGDTLNLDGTNAASWLTAADHANGLGCADCHVFPTAGGSTHSTAHNW